MKSLAKHTRDNKVMLNELVKRMINEDMDEMRASARRDRATLGAVQRTTMYLSDEKEEEQIKQAARTIVFKGFLKFYKNNDWTANQYQLQNQISQRIFMLNQIFQELQSQPGLLLK